MVTAQQAPARRGRGRVVLAGLSLGAGLGSVVGAVVALTVALVPVAVDPDVSGEVAGVLVLVFAALLIGGFLGLVAGVLTGLAAGLALVWLLGRGTALSRAAWGSALLSCWIPVVFGVVAGRSFGAHAVVVGVIAGLASLAATWLFSRWIARSVGLASTPES